MSRAPKVDVEVRGLIEGLALKGRGAAEIYRHLEHLEQRRHLKGRLPTQRTVQRLVKDIKPPDPSEAWNLADADPEESRGVLDVVAAIVEGSGGRVWPTRELADWIVRVRAAAPTMDPWQVYVFASVYRARTKGGFDTNDLDRLLAFKPWESAEAKQHYESLMFRLLETGMYAEGVLLSLDHVRPEEE